MEVRFTRTSDARHRVTVVRDDGSVDTVELDSKDYLRHDLAHFVVESELGMPAAVWGSVAVGGSLAGNGIDGSDVALAERLAGPVQTLMRTGAGAAEWHTVLDRVAPGALDRSTVERLRERARQVMGHWAATAHGADMVLHWSTAADRPGSPSGTGG